MFRYLLLGVASSLLFGCHTNNPYQADGLPLPPAPAAAATHFDSSAYPAQVNTKTYTYWCWHGQFSKPTDDASVENSAQRILAEQLEQHALRPASSAAQCELKVQLISSQRQHIRRDYDEFPSAYYGSGYGNGYYDRHRYSGIGVNIPIRSRSYTEYYQLLTLTLTDAQTEQTVWRTQSTVSSDQQAQSTEEALRKAIDSMLSSYR